MKVKELMIRDVKTCLPEDDLNRAAQIMWDNDCGTVPVVDGAGVVQGMITDRDLCMAAYTKGRTLGAMRVAGTMAKDVVTCSPEDTLETALAAMMRARVRRLPVTERNGRLAGILSINDVAREATREIESGKANAIRTEFTLTMGAICERTPSLAKREGKAAPKLVHSTS